MFYTLGRGRGGNVYVYALKLKQFVFSNEIIETGISEIDNQIFDSYPRTRISLSSGSGTFVANEIVQGDYYILDITGGASYAIGTNSTYSIVFGATTISYSPTYTVAIGGQPPIVNIKAIFLITGAVGVSCAYKCFLTHNCSNVATNSASAFSRAYVQTGTVNTTTGFTLQVSYLSANTGDSMSCHAMSLIKQ